MTRSISGVVLPTVLLAALLAALGAGCGGGSSGGGPAPRGDRQLGIDASYAGTETFMDGYNKASETACGSSEAMQASFVRSVFAAWDTLPTRIPVVNVNWLTDVSAATLAQWEAYYGLSDPAFLGFLGSLGLRTSAPVEKQAFGALVDEAVARGWVPRDPM